MQAENPAQAKRVPYGRGLSARLLAITLAAVMLAEVLIFVPSLAGETEDELRRRIETASLAVLSLRVAPDMRLNAEDSNQALLAVDAHLIAYATPTGQNLALLGTPDFKVAETSAYPDWNTLGLARLGLSLLGPAEDLAALRLSDVPLEAGLLELVIERKALAEPLRSFALRILLLSLFISGLAGALAYASLYVLAVQPIRRLAQNLTAFSQRPDLRARQIRPSKRRDEIGLAERETLKMQRAVHEAMGQQARLAALGSAVAQINHDMKNSLATAVLLSDRLESSSDTAVARSAPLLTDSLDRATHLLESTLAYARSGTLDLDVETLDFAELIEALSNGLKPQLEAHKAEILARAEPGAKLSADRHNLLRALNNLALNAVEAGASRVEVLLEPDPQHNGCLGLTIQDNGPGLAKAARDQLFVPFAGSTKRQGSGLGLVTAREVFQAHGGDLKLSASDANGTRFLGTLPPS